jgi:tRNA pseudouridine55 synthase
VNKPRGPTSFNIISQVRRLLKTKKVGHCGTLDPEAEGLLLIAVGSSTRLLQYVKIEPKTYHFGVQFGSETDSYDLQGQVTSSGGHFPIHDDLVHCLNRFKGIIKQVPPTYSAVKINGVRACDLARKGQTPTLKERDVTIHNLELLSYNSTSGTAELTVTCSTGTYVRSLIRDISHECSTFGTATFINRNQIGDYTLNDATVLDETTILDDQLISDINLFKNECQIAFPVSDIEKIIQGKNIYIDTVQSDVSLIFAKSNGTIFAVLKKITDQWYHPETVLSAAVL